MPCAERNTLSLYHSSQWLMAMMEHPRWVHFRTLQRFSFPGVLFHRLELMLKIHCEICVWRCS
ncbi:hypothetical protein V6Z12_D13G184600 [Gossypium hirsutum]